MGRQSGCPEFSLLACISLLYQGVVMAQPDEIGHQVEAWKRKYYDALGEQEAQERQWRQAEELLRKTISRLTLAADGLDSTLDGHLKALRDAIRDRADARVLRQRIEAMSASLVRLDSKRSPKTVAASPLQPLQSLLDSLQLPPGQARQVKAFRKQLERATYDVPSAVADFAALLQTCFGETPPASSGLLGRLFGREPSQAVPAGDAAATPPSAQSVSAARELLLHLLENLPSPPTAETLDAWRKQAQDANTQAELKRLADALAQTFQLHTEPAAALPVAQSGAQSSGSELLLQLLEQLDWPSELDSQVTALKTQLETPAVDVHKMLRALANLIAEMRARLQREKEEIEHFLKQLTGQLQDIDSFVRGTETARAESYQSGRDLGQAVQAQVRGIEDSVASAPSLDILKRAVQQRLDAIIDHVEQHRVKEELRNTQVDSQVKDLTERIQAMEQEAAKLRERIREERVQAMTDTLTGIPNRLAYEERIAQEYARWKRFNTPLAILVWDVDLFKRINDAYGHKAGDKVLKVIAETLAEKIRETDFLARFGGEEFVLIATGAAQSAIIEVADKLRLAVQDCGFHFRGEAVTITLSCGIAEFRDGDTIEAVFERADAALYRAKSGGRNCCILDGVS